MDGPDLASEDDEVEPPDDVDGDDFGDALSSVEDDEQKEENFEVGEVDLGVEGGDDIIAGFDGIEDDEPEEEPIESSSGGGGGVGDTSTIQEAIEEGMAEVAVVGLRGRERDRVRSEMEAVASKFKLGYFGEQVAQKYLKRDLDDIPPEYGLAAAMLAFAAVTLYKRPDGEQKVREAVDALRNSISGDEDQSPEPESQEETDE